MIKDSNDYMVDITEAKARVKSIEEHVKFRLEELAKANPEAIVTKIDSVDIKAKSITREWIERQDVYTQIVYIRAIELHNDRLQGGRQTSILD